MATNRKADVQEDTVDYTEEFENWWAYYWKPMNQPETMNNAFKEVAFRAWLAAISIDR